MNDTQPATSGFQVFQSHDVVALADAALARLGEGLASTADPFARPLILTPGAGLQRWLSQHIARAQGICTGLDLQRQSALPRLLADEGSADDAWAPEHLAWAILRLADTGGFGPLSHHLRATDQRYASALRVARLLDRYARRRPDMMLTWLATDDVDALGLGFDAWQAALWRALHAEVDAPDPAQWYASLVAGLREGSLDERLTWPSVTVFAPRRVTVPEVELWRALASRVEVTVWLPTSGPWPTAHPLAQALGHREEDAVRLLGPSRTVPVPSRPAPTTTLGWLQADVRDGVPPKKRPATVGDRSVVAHVSHGAARQAEVLREALTATFAEIVDLEPREVVIVCPHPDDYALHLKAAFTAPVGVDVPHPATTLRVQVADADASHANQVAGLMRRLLQVESSRATVSEVLELAAHPFVARRFGLSPDDLERLGELVAEASVRWGLDRNHREVFGLGGVDQGTWAAGLQRLMLGEALADDGPPLAVRPIDKVASHDIAPIGALNELLMRLYHVILDTHAPATLSVWAERLRTMAEQMVAVPFDESWQLQQFWSVLARWEQGSAGGDATLGVPDVLALLDDAFAHLRTRPAYGNGSLVVTGLEGLAQVPHRVVCLVGFDESSFPRRGIADGDDLLARDRRPGEPDPGRDDRQALLDAVMAATERLIVVYPGRSSITNKKQPPAPGLADVLKAAEATAEPPIEVVEPLHDFAASNFDVAAPRSFDRLALRAAEAAQQPGDVAREVWNVGQLAPTSTTSLTLDQVRRFVSDPLQFFLKERASLSKPSNAVPEEELPLTLTPLERWGAGDRVLADLAEGRPLDEALHRERQRMALPVGMLGEVELRKIGAEAEVIWQGAGRWAEPSPTWHTIDLRLPDAPRLGGSVGLRDGRVVLYRFGALRPVDWAAAWWDALAATLQTEVPTPAVLVGRIRRRGEDAPDVRHLAAVTPPQARAHLAAVARLTAEGLTAPVTLPARTGHAWASVVVAGKDPTVEKKVANAWRDDQKWSPWAETIGGLPWQVPGFPAPLPELVRLVWEPIVKAAS